MGKPSPPTASVETDADAVSLHSQPEGRFYDIDAPELPDDVQNDDLPPLYDEVAETSAPLLSAHHPAIRPGLVPGLPDTLQPFRTDDDVSYFLSKTLDTDAELLESRVRDWAAVPPRPFVRVYGYHRERHRDSANKKSENKNVTDFDVKVELTPYLCPLGGTRGADCELRTVENGEKAKRGGVFRRRAPGARKGGRIELGMVEKPSLTEWCHMYCASHTGLKVFQLERGVAGLNHDRLREHLESMVRRTNYRGHLSVSFPVQNARVEVWNECRTNQWRLTKWIYVVFCVSMLWLFTWPYLFFRTKRFETVSAVWIFSRQIEDTQQRSYVTISEDQWYNLWGRAISKAVLQKRQGTLGQDDLLAADAVPTSFNTGRRIVDGALDVVAAGVSAMNEVNRHLGWGEDQC